LTVAKKAVEKKLRRYNGWIHDETRFLP